MFEHNSYNRTEPKFYFNINLRLDLFSGLKLSRNGNFLGTSYDEEWFIYLSGELSNQEDVFLVQGWLKANWGF